MNSQLSGAEFQTIRVIIEGKLLQKRSNGATEGYVRYVVNGNSVAQPYGNCECRCGKSPSSSTSNREEVPKTRYNRSLSSHSRPKRQLTKNLFVPNVDDRFEIFQSFGDKENEEKFSQLDEAEVTRPQPQNRHTSNIPMKFEPLSLDQDHRTLPKEPAQTPSVKRFHSTPHNRRAHPSPKYRVDPLRKSQRINYSEFVVPKTDDDGEVMSDFTHRERLNKVPPVAHYQHSPTHNHHFDNSEPYPVERHHHSYPSSPLQHIHHTEHTDKYHPVTPIEPYSPPKDCKQTDISKLLSRIQADYFACCDNCRQKMVNKYGSEGCGEYLKSVDPTVTQNVPCKSHEPTEISSPKCGCDHNQNILESLKKVSEKLCELSTARAAKIRREKELSKSDVKRNLLQQLNKIYEKLISLKGTDEIKNICPKRRGH